MTATKAPLLADVLRFLRELRIAAAKKVRLSQAAPFCVVSHERRVFLIYLCPACTSQTAIRLGTAAGMCSTATHCDQCNCPVTLLMTWEVERVLKNLCVSVVGRVGH